jgi:uncharacterized membrane-anchored protein
MEKKSSKQSKSINKEYLRLIIALGVLLLITLSFTLYLSWPLLTGTTVVLATRPVDPFDPLRGQYMTIGYEIANIPIIDVVEGTNIYITLKEDNEGIWRYDKSSLTIPSEGIFIKGTVLSTRRNLTNVQYGIEQFFFERNAKVPTRNITVKAKISSTGGARIVELLQDGQPIEIKYSSSK